MRLLIPLLIVANGVAFAWWQGSFDPWLGPERQPERLERQIAPQALRIVPVPASAGPGETADPGPPGPGPAVCLLVPARDDEQAQAIARALAKAGLASERSRARAAPEAAGAPGGAAPGGIVLRVRGPAATIAAAAKPWLGQPPVPLRGCD